MYIHIILGEDNMYNYTYQLHNAVKNYNGYLNSSTFNEDLFYNDSNYDSR